MADPQRVRAFLDLFGAWDPTLAFVMGGALAPMAIAWAIQRRMARPILADAFDLPPTRGIDVPLAAGAVIFGVGRSEEHTSELQSLMRISYAIFCLTNRLQ